MPNQVVNGNFSNGGTGWTLLGNVGVGGSRQAAVFSSGNSTVNGAISQTVDVVAGQDYDFSFEYGRNGRTGTSGDFDVTYIDASGVQQTLASGSYTDGTGGGVADTVYPTQNITIPAGVTRVTIRFVDTTSNTNSRDLYIDDVVLDGPTPAPICFCHGTLIETETGPMPVEKLVAGTLVRNASQNLVPVRAVFKRTITLEALRQEEHLRPIRIVAGALGNGLPERDLMVSRQHRMMVSSKIATKMFGVSSVLIPAIRLTELPGVFVEQADLGIEYFHLLFDQHEIIFAEGALSESLFVGPFAKQELSRGAYAEILSLFPTIDAQHQTSTLAKLVPDRKTQKKLIARHLKNNKALTGYADRILFQASAVKLSKVVE